MRTPLISRFKRPFVPMIVVLDSQKTAQEGAAFRQIGVDAILTHPLRRQHLREEVRKIVENEAIPVVPFEPEPPVPVRERVARLLVADDVPENLLLIKAFLNKLPVEPTFADNGRDALQQFQQGSFDLVVLDIEMPGMDGYTALRHMREWEQANGMASTPIIALTAHGTFEHQEKAREAGFTHHVAKPIRKRDFLWLLNHFVYGTTPSSSRPALNLETDGAGPARVSGSDDAARLLSAPASRGAEGAQATHRSGRLREDRQHRTQAEGLGRVVWSPRGVGDRP
jgi:CheY-like chemotaxis protein